MTKLDDLALHMITYYAANPARIQHFIKVHSFAALIARQEGMDAVTLEMCQPPVAGKKFIVVSFTAQTFLCRSFCLSAF